MRTILLAGILAAIALPAGPALAQDNNDREYRREVKDARKDYRRDQREVRRDQRDDRQDGRRDDRRDDRRADYRRYDYNRPDPRYGNYQADRYYRAGNNYKARRLAANDRVYRGSDNRYYCRRTDGTTGLIIGGIGGGALGNIIAPGDSKTLGTILGAGAGALLGRSVDRNNVTCR